VELVLSDTKEDKLDDEADEGAESGECGGKGHKYSPRAMVVRTAQTEKNGKTGEASRDGEEDESEGKVVNNAGVQPMIAVRSISICQLTSRRRCLLESKDIRLKMPANGGSCARVAEHAEAFGSTNVCFEETDVIPCRRAYRNLMFDMSLA
jgi:hypothetical protein